MTKKPNAAADTRVTPTKRRPKAIVEDLHPRAGSGIRGGITPQDIPIIIRTDKSTS